MREQEAANEGGEEQEQEEAEEEEEDDDDDSEEDQDSVYTDNGQWEVNPSSHPKPPQRTPPDPPPRLKGGL
jgi:hypothetical protein